jgi:RNA polymerase sigma factor (sigma-70 family)
MSVYVRRSEVVAPAALFAAYHDRLRVQLARIVRTSRENLEDACSFAWLQLLRCSPEPETAYAWLVTVAVHEAVRLDRRSRRLSPLCREDGTMPGLCETADPVRLREQVLEAAATLDRARLTRRERRVLGLRAAGYSYGEIARMTGDSVRTVERQLWRARRKLPNAPAS